MHRRRGRRSSRPWHSVLFAVAAAALIGLGISQLGTPVSSARTSTELVTAQSGVVQDTVSGSGNVEPGVEQAVNFATGGTLQSIDVRVGERVKKGQLIATLDPSAAELTVSQAQDNLKAAEDQLSAAQTGGSSGSASTPSSSSASTKPTSAATKTTSTSTSTSTTSKSSSASAIAQAQAQVDSAEATLTSAQQTLSETRLYAPVSGTVAALSSDQIGQTVSAGGASGGSGTGGGSGSGSGASQGSAGSGSSSSSNFATIIDSRTLTMTVALSESDISSVKVGQLATISMSALSGVELAAKVSAISPLGTSSSGVVSYNVTLTTSQSDPKVLPGMSATAAIVISQQQGVTVPNQALSGSGSSATVQLDSGGRISTRQVVVGLRGSSRSVILSGLRSGQQVQVTITLPALRPSTTATTGSTGGFGGGGGFFGGGGGGRGALRALLGAGGGAG